MFMVMATIMVTVTVMVISIDGAPEASLLEERLDFTHLRPQADFNHDHNYSHAYARDRNS